MPAKVITGLVDTPFFCAICMEDHPAGSRFGGHEALEDRADHPGVIHQFCLRKLVHYLNTEEQINNPSCPLCRTRLHPIEQPRQAIGILGILIAIFQRLLRTNEIVTATLQI